MEIVTRSYSAIIFLLIIILNISYFFFSHSLTVEAFSDLCSTEDFFLL